MATNELFLPSIEEIIEINRKFNGGVRRGDLEFILSKIISLKLGNDHKKNVARSAATLWYYIIQNHVFIDGNKRTATESAKHFCSINSIELDMPPNGLIYVSLKIANNDIRFNELEELIYKRLRRR
ncbi:MAG: type II toxin-antitoxin system death-on-curing family toxin [Candidatus Aenigmarchaeota archaeon]|nr:type II toxin-antitoxin system death-on-curing family toxin [Candidatus Aenigmarchaeota archaeon]